MAATRERGGRTAASRRVGAGSGEAPHTPLRPMWCCRACGQPWPCGPARLRLRTEYDADRPGLSIYLAGLMYEAMRDLYHFNAHDAPEPGVLFDRFLAWARRRPAVDPPT
ncbi:hypothetical protein [Micromonospora sp. NPDC049374]|uniref:hypothetical protein n=1 Tax=Micromonospora sp. NPDC049374 TaxID=3154352 RepID=UPI0034236FBE